MQTLLLAGGLGTRIRGVDNDIPKPMLPIGGKPILWHVMSTYAAHGHNEFIIALGYRGWSIKEYFLHYTAMTTDFSLTLSDEPDLEFHRQSPQLNWRVTLAETGLHTLTAARIKRASKYLTGDNFMVTYGDGVGDIDISALIAFHLSHGKIATVTGVRPPGRFGALTINGARVVDFAEKPNAGGGLINGGFFVFKREFIDRLSDAPDVSLESEPLAALAREGELQVFLHEGFWRPMDTHREFMELNSLWEEGSAPWKTWA